jgi:hypothetical protein
MEIDFMSNGYFFRLKRIKNAAPAIPIIEPTIDIPYERKFRKNVDSTTFTTISNGNIIPARSNTRPRIIIRIGVKNLIRTTSKRQSDLVPVHTQEVPSHHKRLLSFSDIWDGNGNRLGD